MGAMATETDGTRKVLLYTLDMLYGLYHYQLLYATSIAYLVPANVHVPLFQLNFTTRRVVP